MIYENKKKIIKFIFYKNKKEEKIQNKILAKLRFKYSL